MAVFIILLACAACSEHPARSPGPPQPAAKTGAPITPPAPATDTVAEQLAACLPEALDSMPRLTLITDIQGCVMAKGSYKAADGGLIEITISEIAQPSKLANLAGANWVTTQFERETADEYERAFLRQGVPVFEMYSRSRRHGQLKTPFDKRWLVEINGYGVAPAQLQRALMEINTGRLKSLPVRAVNEASRPPAAANRRDRTVPAQPPSPAPASRIPGSVQANMESPR